jgi:ketosteroid isomerase-like protein
MRSAFAVVLALLAACAGPGRPPPAAQTSDADTRAIEAVLEQFRAAIIAKDGAAIERLMIAPDVPFRSSQIGDPTNQNASTAAEFARDVTAASTAWEEKFWDVSIKADATLAVLDAAYSFHDDGRMTNDGREIWVLIKTSAGWKIASVTWSVRPIE